MIVQALKHDSGKDSACSQHINSFYSNNAKGNADSDWIH